MKNWRTWFFLILVIIAIAFAYIYSESQMGSLDYQGTALSGKAPDFQLTDQSGSMIKLSDFLGKVVVLIFMDSQCTDTCPLTAAQFRLAYQQLDTVEASKVIFMGVNVNVKANTVADVNEITQAWYLDEIPTWHFLTGSPKDLEQVWQDYNIAVQVSPSSQHEEIVHISGAFIVDPLGEKRWYISIPFGADSNAGFSLPMNQLLVNHIREILRDK